MKTVALSIPEILKDPKQQLRNKIKCQPNTPLLALS
jgi:hypothetical protein